MLIKNLLILIAASSLPLLGSATETRTFDANKLKELEVSNHSGKVHIQAHKSNKIEVQIEKVDFDEKCSIKFNESSKTLKIDIDKPSLLSEAKCKVNFDIKTPESLELEINLGNGTVSVENNLGDLDIKLGSGEIYIDSKCKEFDIKLGSGKLNAKNLMGSSEIKIGAGSAELSYSEVPSIGEIDLKTGKGDVVLLVPKGSKLSSSFKGAAGKLINRIGDTPESNFRVNMFSGAGNLEIKNN